jgi:hypothetical protein
MYVSLWRLHIKFRMPSSNSSLVVSMQVKTKYRFHAAIILLFYVVKKYLVKDEYLSKVFDHTSFQYSIFSVTSTS